MLSAKQLFDRARARTRQLTSDEVRGMMARGEEFILIDVREHKEWNLGHIPGAIHITRGVLESNIEACAPRSANVVLYCQSGNRSAMSACSLQDMGYERVASMSGGIKEWVATGGDIED